MISSVSILSPRKPDNSAKMIVVYYSTQIDEMPMNGMYNLFYGRADY